MYNPINNLGANAFMRWPVAALPFASIIGLLSNSVIGAVLAWVASVILGTYAATKFFKDEICDCEEEVMKKGWGPLPKLKWVIEHNPESGAKKPWELYSMMGDNESTKQHYASYTTEENALAKKELLESMTSTDEDKK